MALDSGRTTFLQGEDLEFGFGAKARFAMPEPEHRNPHSELFDSESDETARLTPVHVRRLRLERDDDLGDIIDAVPLEIWEGEVLSVDCGLMYVKLQSKMTDTETHTAEIESHWVDEQDMDLIMPGAIFYLSLGRTNKRGSVENTEKIRFRRRPDWTSTQAARVRDAGREMHKKFRAKPTADD